MKLTTNRNFAISRRAVVVIYYIGMSYDDDNVCPSLIWVIIISITARTFF